MAAKKRKTKIFDPMSPKKLSKIEERSNRKYGVRRPLAHPHFCKQVNEPGRSLRAEC